MNSLKAIALTSLFLLSFQAMAALDSVGVFHRPEKVIVLINERGEGSRLQTMMNYFEAGETLALISPDQNIKIVCGRSVEAATCTFRFFPGKDSVIGPRTLEASSTLGELGITTLDDFDISFESSMQDRFLLQVLNGKIIFSASKKISKLSYQ